LLLGRIELVLVELDADVELDAMECTEVADAKIVSCTDLANGYNGRCKIEQRAGGAVRGNASEWCKQSPSKQRRHGCAKSVRMKSVPRACDAKMRSVNEAHLDRSHGTDA
jgi:hypothetical protein